MRETRDCLALAAMLVMLAACSGDERAAVRDTQSGQANNVVAVDGIAYASLGAEGMLIFDIDGERETGVVAPPAGMQSIDDIAIADGLLFVLDGRSPGHLAVLSLDDPQAPALVGDVVVVPASRFSGVSAGGGLVVVSGGTDDLTIRQYDAETGLGSDVARVDLGSGQPDVLVASDGSQAYVSTHFEKEDYGITTLSLRTPPQEPTTQAQVELEDSGFTPGVAAPANFPIESALHPDSLLVAHGAGLAVIDRASPGAVKAVVDLPLHAINVDVAGNTAVVVGRDPEPALVFVDLDTNIAGPAIALPSGSHPTSVAFAGNDVVIAVHERLPIVRSVEP